MRIVISGATSFVGINLIRALIKDGENEIIALIRENSPNRSLLNEFGDRIRIFCVDLNNINTLSNYIDYLDAFYLVAWRGTRGQDRNNEEMQKENYIDTIETTKVAIKLNAKTIIGIGSQAEYGYVETKIDESIVPRPTSKYGLYKLKVYQEGKKICEQKSVSFKWGRIFSAYGIGDYSKTLVMYCINNMLKGLPVYVSSCTQMWNYTNIIDIAHIFARMCGNDIPSGLYNVCGDDTRFLKEFVEEIKKITKSSSEILYDSQDSTSEKVTLNPVNSKIKSFLKDMEYIPFDDGILSIINSINLAYEYRLSL